MSNTPYSQSNTNDKVTGNTEKMQNITKLNNFINELTAFRNAVGTSSTKQDNEKLNLCSVFYDIFDAVSKNYYSLADMTVYDIKKNYMEVLSGHLKEFQTKNTGEEKLDPFVDQFKNSAETKDPDPPAYTNPTPQIVKTVEEEELEKEQAEKYKKHIEMEFKKAKELDDGNDFQIYNSDDDQEGEGEVNPNRNNFHTSDETDSDTDSNGYNSTDEPQTTFFNGVAQDAKNIEMKVIDQKFNMDHINDESITKANTATAMETDMGQQYFDPWVKQPTSAEQYSNGFIMDQQSDSSDQNDDFSRKRNKHDMESYAGGHFL